MGGDLLNRKEPRLDDFETSQLLLVVKDAKIKKSFLTNLQK